MVNEAAVGTDRVGSGADSDLGRGIPHYYGDTARGFLLGAAALSLIASPLYVDSMQVQFPFIILGAVAAVVVAALTGPRKRSTLVADSVVAAASGISFASWSFVGYDPLDSLAFLLRGVIALLFFAAMYFSLKTVRAFALHEVGQYDRPGIVEGSEVQKNIDREREQMAREEREEQPRG